MDANGLKFWMLADKAHWSAESDAVQFDASTRTLRLARHRAVTSFPADEPSAEVALVRVPQSIDPFGTRAFWSESRRRLMSG